MKEILMEMLDWTEFWSLLIPLAVIIIRRSVPAMMRPVFIYIIIALVINLMQIYIWKNGLIFWYSSGAGDNIFLYNSHSIIRFLLFSWFFNIILGQRFILFKKLMPFIYLLFIVIDYSFFENFFTISGVAMGMEAAFLLLYCLLYYWKIYDEDLPVNTGRPPEFFVVTGLSIFVVINFPLFLWYAKLAAEQDEFAAKLWYVSNVTYLIFCIFMAVAFNKLRRRNG